MTASPPGLSDLTPPAGAAPPDDAPPHLAARALSVRLEGTPILHDLSFEVRPGTWTGLLGPNGSGKTTLLRALRGLLPHEGALTFDGRPLRGWPARALARRMALVQQAPTLSFDFTVRELVSLGRAPHKRWLAPTTARDRQVVAEALAATDLAALAGRSVLSLSGGELRRALLAQALAQQAGTLLLDEPTTHLDVHHQFALMNRLRTLVDEGRTAVVVFHDLELAARYADELLVLHEGRLVASGPPRHVLTRDLIAEVFRMEAAVDASGAAPRVHYKAPITPPLRTCS